MSETNLEKRSLDPKLLSGINQRITPGELQTVLGIPFSALAIVLLALPVIHSPAYDPVDPRTEFPKSGVGVEPERSPILEAMTADKRGEFPGQRRGGGTHWSQNKIDQELTNPTTEIAKCKKGSRDCFPRGTDGGCTSCVVGPYEENVAVVKATNLLAGGVQEYVET
jgi:hypothetical protein